MGLLMEFYAGSPADIGRALDASDHEALRDGSLAHGHADLSLHLSPDHLDVLSEEVAACTGSAPLLLLDSLEDHLGGTEDWSAEVVSLAWVEAVAAIPDASIAALARSWRAAVAKELGEPTMTAGDDAVQAVEALVRLCREASQRKTRVVFAWFL